ncbi:cytochrome P450 4g15-like [Zophobas morio]|uniref:cytochrome P450 4g15-like n=1 Tax=Zophobas morio TaxID=2755281 RepID=UPI003083E252
MHQFSLTSTFLYFIIALTLYFIWKRRRLYYCSFKHPGPFGFPLIGSAHLLTAGPAESYNTLMRIAQYSPVTRVWFGPFFYLFISKPGDVEILLNKSVDKSIYYAKYLGDALKTGLLISPPEIWKGRRKLINQTFNSNVVNSFVPAFTKCANCLADELDKVCKGTNDPPDLFDIIMKTYLNAGCETLADVRPDSLYNKEKFLATGYRYQKSVKYRFFKPHLNIDYFWKRSSLRKEQLEIGKVFEDFIKQVIAVKQSQPENKNSKKQFLNYLLEMNKQNNLTTDGLLEEGALMLLAANDSTTPAVGSALVLLGMHPEIQEKVYQEISLLTDDTQDLTLECVNKMNYLERVIKETIRIFPSVPFILRKIDEEIELESYFVPANCEILISISQLHRWPDIWPNPLKFDPDRFLPEEVEKRPRGAYLPFGAGARNCIGIKYAMLSMKVFLAVILKRFRILEAIDYKRVEDIEMDIFLFGIAKKGYRIRVEDRN